VVHVAGTNGKGSVAHKIAKTLEFVGHKVGLLISPHISSFRERMSINGVLISESEAETSLQRILKLCDEYNIPATFFEITTALSFLYFSENEVDVVVLETGLGGRLDATNVVTQPALCVITSIGLEHTSILGDTVELIGVEKAGIIKKGTPILVGPNVPHHVIEKCATEKGAEGYYTCEDILGDDGGSNVKVINGFQYVDYDLENSRTAAAALKLLTKKKSNFHFKAITEDHISNGTSLRPSCRFEKVLYNSLSVILDIAHNPPAMKTLIAKLEATYHDRNKRIVVGFSADKDIKAISNLLIAAVGTPSRIHLVEAVNLRAAKIDDIIQADPRMMASNFESNDKSITAQVKSALRLAEEENEVVVICGSVFLMAEARAALGIDEPRDSKAITEVAGKGLLSCKQKLMSLNTKNKI